MGLLKKLVNITEFKLALKHEQQEQNHDFDNFNQILTLRPLDQAKPTPIPRQIWIYWQGSPCELVERCVAKIRALNPHFTVHYLNEDSVKQFSEINFTELAHITPQLKSDLIRLDLLNRHGGYWLDASILTFESLDWIQQLVDQHATEAFAYYRKKNTTLPEFPVIENWLLASHPDTAFLKAWQVEVMKIIQVTAKVYIQQIRQNLDQPEQYFQRINMPEYLCPYIAAQVVMRQHLPSITLINCDANAFFLQIQNGWNKHKVLFDLAIKQKPVQMPKLIKLVGKERNLINQYFIKGKFKANSLLAELA